MDKAEIQLEEKNRKEFRDILYSLADLQALETEEKRAKIYIRLEKLYYISGKEERFRHFYSDIFSVLTQIQKKDNPGSIDVLAQNIGIIRAGYRACNRDSNNQLIDISESVRKLYDHVSLDVSRLVHSESLLSQKADASRLQSQIANISQKADDVRKEIERIQQESKNMQKEYIAILGIFASVVLALTAAFAFSTSVFENMHQSSIYRIVIVASVIGLVFINLIYGLFYYIDRIVHGKSNASIKPLFIVNAIFLVLIVAAIIAWGYGLVEYRNVQIFK